MSSPSADLHEPASTPAVSVLDDVVFILGRAYFNYVGLLERKLRAHQVEELIAPGMGQILFALFEKDDCIIKEIAERVGLSQSTLTGMLTRMEKTKLIERRKDSSDGRAVRVRLTETGRSVEPRCRAILADLRGHLHASLSGAELTQLQSGLCRLAVALRHEPNRSAPLEPAGDVVESP